MTKLTVSIQTQTNPIHIIANQSEKRNELVSERVGGAYIDNRSAPIAKEVSRGRSWPDKAPDIIAFIKCPPHNLPS